MKRIFLVICLLALNLSLISRSYAFSSVLGAKIILDEVRIEGIKVTDPNSAITIHNSTPTFSGYTLSNTKVILVIKSSPIQREALTDSYGYWSYTLNKALDNGKHTLTVRLVNTQGESSDEQLAGTFQITSKEDVLGSKTAAVNSIPNYWAFTIFLSVFFLILLLGYLMLRRKAHRKN